VRANDTTDIHVARGASYPKEPSLPFRTALIDHAQLGRIADDDDSQRHLGANLGLYSITFNNDPELDSRTLEAYRDFRANPLLGRGAWAYSTRDNFYVKLVAESGLLGLASFIGLLCVILRNEWRALMRFKGDDFVAGVAIGLFPASIGSLLIFNLAGDFFQVHRFIGIFWLVLALVLKSARGEGSVPYDGEEAAHSAVR
jgi:hypothetical protein